VGCSRTTSNPSSVAAPEAAALRGIDESGVRAPRDGGGAATAWTVIMAPSAGASSCTTSSTASGATSGSPSDSTTSSGTPSGVRGSLIGASLRAAPTTTSTAVVPVAAAVPEGEDLGKKRSKRMKPQKRRKGREKAGQTEVSKHPYRDIWPAGWSHLEPQPSWPRPLTAPSRGTVSPRLLLRPRQSLPLLWPSPP
jgi:hypothetical protein